MASRSPLRVVFHHQQGYHCHHKMYSPLLQNIPATSRITGIVKININWKINPPNLSYFKYRVYELPPVDMFVTTEDLVLEQRIITVNNVLPLMAVDYQANKLACYVSDDGCSPLTFYAIVEALKFDKLWVPFCKKYNVQVRAIFKYF
ncbi:hypothetical protein Dsin_022099 [Dipteronia sinensis]|uniref:Uncharacterized protein n=1 Tax=Dipteronia sinensis TaxID=43782 RepID=A0AAE0DZQ8_9ROSI|nr:hypothetical protein Dsin_022099 [Dipteronia sinensis]